MMKKMRRCNSAFVKASFCALATAWALTLAGCGGGDASVVASVGSVRLIGDYNIKSQTLFEGIEVGGLSGIDRAPDGRYWAISDDRGGERGTPRMYSLSVDFDGNGFKGVSVQKMVYLKNPDGSLFSSAARTVDPEAIRVAPNGNLYISSEGNWNVNPSLRYQPFVREFKADGSYVRSFEIPANFNYVDNASTGARDNKLFEALGVTPGGTIYTANEDTLIDDGARSSLTAPGVIRVVKLDAASGKSLAQYAYALPQIPVDKAPTATIAPDTGLIDLLAVSETEFLALERSFADGVGTTLRLVRVTIEADSTDVQNIKNLASASYKPLKRELLLEMPITYKGIKLDNIEGMSWGPRLANGNSTLVMVADNNFSASQVTQFLAFEVLPQ